MTAEASGAGQPTLRQITWYLLGRVLVISLFLGGAIVHQVRTGMDFFHPGLGLLYALVATSYAGTILSALLLPRLRRRHLFLQTQIVWDLIFSFLLIYATGASESLFSFLFILVIISASVFFSGRELLVVAAAAAILYGSLLDLQYYGYLPEFRGIRFPVNLAGEDVFYAVFVNVSGFFLAALLAGQLSSRLRRSEAALERQEVDLRELERLNRAIVANIPSGLALVDARGRIRSFNPAAQKITGYSLKEVYNRPAAEVFKGLDLDPGEGSSAVLRGESPVCLNPDRRLVLGYATSMVNTTELDGPGLLVVFQDLTLVKEMEERLKRVDRLAAVGRLASGMAHEIRNPLASISGSVQLLLEGKRISSEERKLMGIVVREAERLSQLLTDFLAYARPLPPQLEVLEVSEVIEEVVTVADGDPCFRNVEIVRQVPEKVRLLADRDRLRQVLWNLLINAAEAMPEGGRILLGAASGSSTLYVEDEGGGIPDSIREKIFDPFFTTKERGTGLGLATVHAIIEAHQGEVRVTNLHPRGARIEVLFPSVPPGEQAPNPKN